MSARDDILGSIRKSLGREALSGEPAAQLRQRLAQPQRNLIPDRTAGRDTAGLTALFADKAREFACTVDEVDSLDAVPEAVRAYLSRENLPARLVQAPALSDGLDWSKTPTLEVKTGTSDGSEDTSVTPVFAAVAETGTLMLTSDATTPTGLNFLPENHIAVLRRSQVVGPLEDAWSRFRTARAKAEGDGFTMPRTVNLITGPSRTGDIEQKIQMGAHGPRRLHVIIVAD
ncbi:LutC/YkgG family protein [Thalassobaculum salexigens]|uniref:LutC/YkgG family protein n=1 Tax=Thalassobaculum salexigens TaxID=455360 RepID=UPI0003FE2C17|nr:lactate utilization protein [Thalassobaculum salexigens]